MIEILLYKKFQCMGSW